MESCPPNAGNVGEPCLRRHSHCSWIFAGLTLGRKELPKPEPVSSKYLAQYKKKQQILLIFRRRIKKIPMKDLGIRLVYEIERVTVQAVNAQWKCSGRG